LETFFCRAADAELTRDELRCESCPLSVTGTEKGTENSCVYRENDKDFPDFAGGECAEGCQMLQEALQFAAMAHKGAFRKGSRVPYILHPMETAMTTLRMTGDVTLASAAALHDVIEDTSYTYEDILCRFGKHVADIVLEESENKRRDMTPEQSWKIRKEEGLERISKASRDAKVVALSDKLSNMRATHRGYLQQKDTVFERFHSKKKEDHAWYHGGLLDALSELSYTQEYQEYVRLYEDVFGKSPDAKQE